MLTREETCWVDGVCGDWNVRCISSSVVRTTSVTNSFVALENGDSTSYPETKALRAVRTSGETTVSLARSSFLILEETVFHASAYSSKHSFHFNI